MAAQQSTAGKTARDMAALIHFHRYPIVEADNEHLNRSSGTIISNYDDHPVI